MSKSVRKNAISLKDKIDSFHLSFETSELTSDVSNDSVENPSSSVYSKGKRLWVKDKKSPVIEKIDFQLRKRFQIKEDCKLITCLYYPPEKNDNGSYKDKRLVIKDGNTNVISRIIISTVLEKTEISYGKMQGEEIELRPWVAYKSPAMIGGMLTYTFENSNTLTIPQRKGFRQVKKSKNVSNRHILVFDYLISENEMKSISEAMLSKLSPDFSSSDLNDKSSLGKEETKSIMDAIENLKN